MQNRNQQPNRQGRPSSRGGESPRRRPPQRETRSANEPAPRQRNERKKTDKRAASSRNPRVKNYWFSAIAMVIATVVACIFLAFFILRSASDLFGLNQPDNPYIVQIPEGADIKEVADILGKTGVVDTPLAFRAYMTFKEKEPVINPGEYMFNSNMAYDEIIIDLKTTRIEDKTVWLTFPEYFSLEEIANLLEEEHVIESSEEFLTYLDENEFPYDFLDDIPSSDLRYHRYEGYFFPDTYEFLIGERFDSIAGKFFSNFERKITNEMYSQMKRWDLTLDQTITLASVIQKEAGHRKDMLRVSSVFHNRMNNAEVFPRLESDVTLLYVEEFIKPHMTSPNQDMYDAYNTYVKEGLPVGPICNPGIEAIHSALNPIDTDYYYFVTDVNQDFYYSATMDKHLQNIESARQVDETGGGVVHGVGTRDPED